MGKMLLDEFWRIRRQLGGQIFIDSQGKECCCQLPGCDCPTCLTVHMPAMSMTWTGNGQTKEWPPVAFTVILEHGQAGLCDGTGGDCVWLGGTPHPGSNVPGGDFFNGGVSHAAGTDQWSVSGGWLFGGPGFCLGAFGCFSRTGGCEGTYTYVPPLFPSEQCVVTVRGVVQVFANCLMPFYRCMGGTCGEDRFGGYPTLDDCNEDCQPPVMYDCVDGHCVPGTTYPSLEVCEQDCGNWDCFEGLCFKSLGGPFESFLECSQQCPRFDCADGLCIEVPGGEFPTLDLCLESCVGQEGFDCIPGTGCVPGSQFPSFDECVQVCPAPPALPVVRDDRDYERLRPGRDFIDPEGNRRTKPYVGKMAQRPPGLIVPNRRIIVPRVR